MIAELPPGGITDEMLQRIRDEYLEMPGLCLTLRQVQRLWGLDEETCRDAMQLLVESKFLRQAVVDAPDFPPASTIRFRRLEPVAVPLDRRAVA